MVQVTFDTNGDSLQELQYALQLLEQAIQRRRGAPKMDMPAVEETAVDTPFLKITVKDSEQKPVPTLNQLLHDESLTEDELGRLFKEQMAQEEEHKKPHKEEKKGDDPYIEIIEYDKEK